MSKTKSKQATSAAAKPVKAAKTIYRVWAAGHGGTKVGDYATADEATRHARAYQDKHKAPVEVTRGKLAGTEFTAEFSEVLAVEGEVAPTAKAKSKPAEKAKATPKRTKLANALKDFLAAPTPVAGAKATEEAATPASTDEPAATAKEKAATPKAAKPAKPAKPSTPRKLSALDAAAQVLARAEKAMNTIELIDEMAAQGLWSSPHGKTPHATLHAALQREIAAKGPAARFRKAERGHFALVAKS